MLLTSLRRLVSKCKYNARRSETRRYVYIVNIVRYPTDRLVNLLHGQKVATLPQLKAALGTSVTLTVLRKLAPLDYRSSYSHCGAYYTLDSIAQYDPLGLWSHRDIHFSRRGTLLNTAEVLVTGVWTESEVPPDSIIRAASRWTVRVMFMWQIPSITRSGK